MIEKIVIDPSVEYNYASYYIEGFKEVCNTVVFDSTPFSALNYRYGRGMAVCYVVEGKNYHVFIDFHDLCEIEEDAYVWSDVYGKINVRKDDVMKYPKILAIGPSFGCKNHSLLSLLILGLIRFPYIRNNSVSFKEFISDYAYLAFRRRPISDYEIDTDVDDNYIFHASTLWYDDKTHTTTNAYRGEFVKACRNAGLMIEGGLFYIESPEVIRQYPNYVLYKKMYGDFLFRKRLKMHDYIKKTKKSVVVFNTPSVGECHGWKLAEYLCMGKAIISMPLSREMPGKGIEHGKNIHFVNTKEEIYDAVIKIKEDVDYRHQLECGARDYYLNYLTPSKVALRLLDSCVDKSLL